MNIYAILGGTAGAEIGVAADACFAQRCGTTAVVPRFLIADWDTLATVYVAVGVSVQIKALTGINRWSIIVIGSRKTRGAVAFALDAIRVISAVYTPTPPPSEAPLQRGKRGHALLSGG